VIGEAQFLGSLPLVVAEFGDQRDQAWSMRSTSRSVSLPL
jgi:hypothetical protein